MFKQFEFTDEERILSVKELLRKLKQDLAEAEMQEWVFTKEAVDPKHMGKQQAESSLAIYQKRIRFLKENIQMVYLYAEDRKINL